MAEFGDKQIHSNKEVAQRSEINFLTVGDVRPSESFAQKEVNNRISRAQDSVMAIVDKLAAYHPNGYQGVLDSLVPGPAYDHLASALRANSTTFA